MSGRQNRNRTFGWRAAHRSPHAQNKEVARLKALRRGRQRAVLLWRARNRLDKAMGQEGIR